MPTFIKQSDNLRVSSYQRPQQSKTIFRYQAGDCEELFELARSGCINVNSNQLYVNATKLVGETTLQELSDKFNTENKPSVKRLDESQKLINPFIRAHGNRAAITNSEPNDVALLVHDCIV